MRLMSISSNFLLSVLFQMLHKSTLCSASVY